MKKEYDAVIVECPSDYTEFIGKSCTVCEDKNLTIIAGGCGLKTSDILSVQEDNDRITYGTKSGSRYVFQKK